MKEVELINPKVVYLIIIVAGIAIFLVLLLLFKARKGNKLINNGTIYGDVNNSYTDNSQTITNVNVYVMTGDPQKASEFTGKKPWLSQLADGVLKLPTLLLDVFLKDSSASSQDEIAQLFFTLIAVVFTIAIFLFLHLPLALLALAVLLLSTSYYAWLFFIKKQPVSKPLLVQQLISLLTILYLLIPTDEYALLISQHQITLTHFIASIHDVWTFWLQYVLQWHSDAMNVVPVLIYGFVSALLLFAQISSMLKRISETKLITWKNTLFQFLWVVVILVGLRCVGLIRLLLNQ